MRRLRLLSLVWALAAPALTLAQGAIVGANGDDLVIGADECETTSTDTIDLVWTFPTVVASGVYRMYATSKDPSTGTGTLKTCATTNDTTASPAVYAAQIGGDIIATQGEQQKTGTFETRLFPAAANRSCSVTTDQVIYVCVHFLPYDANQNTPTVTAVASGSMTLSTGKPATPTDLTLKVGDTRLYASWKAGSGGTATKDYLIEATAAGVPTRTSTSTTTSGSVDGLVNGKQYSVVVYARTAAGTKSGASAAATGTPERVLDFWDIYADQEGPEQGGCGGAAGPLALLGLAGVAALRRARRQP